MTYMLLVNCALKLVEEIILYYDARSKKHQIKYSELLKRILVHCRNGCVRSSVSPVCTIMCINLLKPTC